MHKPEEPFDLAGELALVLIATTVRLISSTLLPCDRVRGL